MIKKTGRRFVFWPRAVIYLIQILMLCIVPFVAVDVDTLADMLDGGIFRNSAPAGVLFACLTTILQLIFDCWRLIRCDRSKERGLLSLRSWFLTISVWAVVLIWCCCHRTERETIDGITWRYTISNGNAIIGRGRQNARAAISIMTSGDLMVPSSLGGHPVTGIGEYAFRGCKSLVSVSIPRGVRWIGSEAFNGCDGLESVVLPDSLAGIQYEAFCNCRNLASVTIPANIEYIDETAFVGTPFLDRAPAGLIAFSGIAYRWKGDSPEEVVIPDGVTRIFGKAFERQARLKSVKVANSVTNIGAAAFHGCSGLASVTLGNQVASIGNDAFRACFNLSAISIPKSLMSVGEGAFRGCRRIEKIYVEKGDSERVRDLLRGQGVDVDTMDFLER